jgi:predicted enzyme related to lactoylglutathione lyase
VDAVALSASIVLAADDPARLARFYAALLEVPAEVGLSATHWRVPWPGGGHLEIYAPSRSRPQPRRSGRLALCLRRDVPGADAMARLEAWISEATGLGATPAEPPRQEPFGAEAWLLDPEGNRLLLLVASALPP